MLRVLTVLPTIWMKMSKGRMERACLARAVFLQLELRAKDFRWYNKERLSRVFFDMLLKRASMMIFENLPNDWLRILKTLHNKEHNQPEHLSPYSTDELLLTPHIKGHAAHLMSPKACTDREFAQMLDVQATLFSLGYNTKAFRHWAAKAIMYYDVDSFQYGLRLLVILVILVI